MLINKAEQKTVWCVFIFFFEYKVTVCIVFYNQKTPREHCANQANTNKSLLT